jgi:hypothetical protein
MNETGSTAIFSSWLKGDIRTDGWKSDWRRGFERRSAEDRDKRQYVSAPQIKVRQKTRYQMRMSLGLCIGCGGEKTSKFRCSQCLAKQVENKRKNRIAHKTRNAARTLAA